MTTENKLIEDFRKAVTAVEHARCLNPLGVEAKLTAEMERTEQALRAALYAPVTA